jgi:hypothetical protein
MSQIGIPDKQIDVEPVKLPDRHPKTEPAPAAPVEQPAEQPLVPA